MPLIKNSDELPVWSELDYYKIISLSKGSQDVLKRTSKKELLFLCEGECKINLDGIENILSKGMYIDLNLAVNKRNILAAEDSIMLIIGGKWGEETGSWGVFDLDNSQTPRNIGDNTDYKRTTEFDNHFHDCDEYWIIFKGSGLAVSEGNFYKVNHGECIVTQAGDHHDFPEVYEKIKGVWFETTLKGEKRKGHLWNHTHKR